ncbi:hypothetical protein IW256_005257 [Actinomadura viridis]|uniref:Uncharacterized protein n=1 Tax=Actinomadura viridis TaxID=58110 RepID=A0A931GSR8_9ACTN|nr:hypothetical protein [Actinomadura viridis]
MTPRGPIAPAVTTVPPVPPVPPVLLSRARLRVPAPSVRRAVPPARPLSFPWAFVFPDRQPS